MKKRMALMSSLFFTVNIYATGIPVLDGANVTQSIITSTEEVAQTLKQVQEYRTQLQQYENMLQNTVAPYAYVWDQAQQTMNGLRNAVNTIDYYKNKFGSIDGFLGKFKDVNYYRSSPCFSLNGCSEQDMTALYNDMNYGSEVQKTANDAVVRNIDLQQDSLNSDARSLQVLQSRAQSATGQMEALQYANQMASAQINQLLQIRAAMLAAQEAENARRQAIADLEAKQKAGSDHLREGMGNIVVKSNQSWQFK